VWRADSARPGPDSMGAEGVHQRLRAPAARLENLRGTKRTALGLWRLDVLEPEAEVFEVREDARGVGLRPRERLRPELHEGRDLRQRKEATPALDDETFGALDVDLHEDPREGARLVGEIIELD